jgi:hypothetical protein
LPPALRPAAVLAQEVDSSIAACLKAWGDHPFGKTPQFKTLGTSVKVFGLGTETGDKEPTSAPALVLINPSVNLMGVSAIELLNPNGWYCLRTAISIMGRVSIRAHCKAHLASSTDGRRCWATTPRTRADGDGSTNVERVGCN